MKYSNFISMYIVLALSISFISATDNLIPTNDDYIAISFTQEENDVDLINFMQKWCTLDTQVPTGMIDCCKALSNNEPIKKTDVLCTLAYMTGTLKKLLHDPQEPLNRLFVESIEACDFTDIIGLINQLIILFNTCCAQFEFNGTFTVLTDILNSITTCCAIIENDFTGVFTALADLNGTLTSCCAEIAVDFQGTLTVVQTGFAGTFTSLTELNETLTTCCAEIAADFQTIFTTIAHLTANCMGSCLPTPITAPFVITASGYYCLQADGNGPITINASDVTLDLNNHALNGGGSSNGVIINPGANRVVKNGALVDCVIGVLGSTVNNTILTNLFISDCTTNGILFSGSAENIIDSVFITGITGIGVQFTGTNDSNLIKAVNVSQSQQGFVLTDFSNGLLVDCQVFNCVSNIPPATPFYGYLITAGNFNEIINCSIKNFISNQSRGISLVGCSNALVTQCTLQLITTNTASGLDLIGFEYDSASTNIECNECLATDLLSSASCTAFALEGTTITLNGCIVLTCSSSSGEGNGFLITGTDVSLNVCEAYSSNATGFLAVSQAPAMLQSCYATSNGNGFVIDNNVLVGNCISAINNNIGFSAPATAIIYKCFATKNGTNYSGTVPNVQNADAQVNMANPGLSGPFAGGNLFSL